MHRSDEAVRIEIEDHLSSLGDPGRYAGFEQSMVREMSFNIERGLKKSLAFGAIGFLIPVCVLGPVVAFVAIFVDNTAMDQQQTLGLLPSFVLLPAIGCGLLFALAAFASFAPTAGLSFTRSLILIGLALVLSIFATQLRPRRKAPSPYAWTYTVVPLTVAAISCAVILAIGSWNRPISQHDPAEIDET